MRKCKSCRFCRMVKSDYESAHQNRYECLADRTPKIVSANYKNRCVDYSNKKLSY